MGKLLDLTERLNTQKHKTITSFKTSAPVVDLTEPRQAILSEERRELRRTILTEFVGAFVVVPERGLLRVNLFDISDVGLSFEVDGTQGRFDQNERVAMRIYLNHKTYFEFVAQMKWHQVQEDGMIRHGGKFIKNTVNDVALGHFVKFIEAVSVNLKADDGDLQISSGS